MGSNEVKWVQMPLLEGGHSDVMLEVTVHLGGVPCVALVGWSLTDTPTREPIGICTRWDLLSAREPVALERTIGELIRAALGALQPFP